MWGSLGKASLCLTTVCTLLACISRLLTPWLQVTVVWLQTLLRKPALQVHFLIKCGRGLGVGTVTWSHFFLLPLALSLDDLPWETRGDGSLESTGRRQAVRLCRVRPSRLSTGPPILQTLSQPPLCSSQQPTASPHFTPESTRGAENKASSRQKPDCSTPLAQLGQQNRTGPAGHLGPSAPAHGACAAVLGFPRALPPSWKACTSSAWAGVAVLAPSLLSLAPAPEPPASRPPVAVGAQNFGFPVSPCIPQPEESLRSVLPSLEQRWESGGKNRPSWRLEPAFFKSTSLRSYISVGTLG